MSGYRRTALSKLNEITSTEKLLEVIRKKNADNFHTVPDHGASGRGRRGQLFRFPSLLLSPLRKPVTVGVDIGYEYLRLVKTQKQTDNKWKLLNYRSVRIPPFSSRESPEFAGFLKSELASFCGNRKGYAIWTIIPTAQLDIHHILIPKVEQKQIENAVFWTVKKEHPFDEKKTVFDFEMQGKAPEQGIAKLQCMAYTIPKEPIEERNNLFSKIGFSLTGISAIPFALQNILRVKWPVPFEETFACLFIGNEFSRIDIYHRGNLLMARDIKTGTSSMVESVVEEYNRKNAGKNTINTELARKAVISLCSDQPPFDCADAGVNITPEDIFDMITPALERLVRQVERTFEHFARIKETAAVRKVYVSSTLNPCRPILDYIGNQLGMGSEVLDPLKTLFAAGGGDANVPSLSERNALVPALGLAVSDNAHTPNLIFTQRDKETASAVSLINRAIFAVFIIAASLCSAVLLSEGYAARQKKITIAALEKQLAGYRPVADQNVVRQLVSQVKQQQQLTKAYGERYLGMAIISELTALTPRDINLISMKAYLGAVPGQKNPAASRESAKDTPKSGERDITVEGLIFGKRESAEALLAGYIVKLDGSPMFRQLTVQKNSFESFKKGEALHFIINAKIG